MHAELRLACLAANRELWKSGLAPLGLGSASVCDRRAGVLAVRPEGIPFAGLTADQIVMVSLDGQLVGSDQRPSKDLGTHLRLYEAFPCAGAVVHTCSKFATVWAQAGHPIPCLGTTHAAFFHDEIPVTRLLTESEVSGDYECAIGNVIAERFAEGLDPKLQSAVLVAGQGGYAWGENAATAVEVAVALEWIAENTLWTLALTRDCASLPEFLRDRSFPKG